VRESPSNNFHMRFVRDFFSPSAQVPRKLLQSGGNIRAGRTTVPPRRRYKEFSSRLRVPRPHFPLSPALRVLFLSRTLHTLFGLR
jgi:hypothetical protein